MKQTLERLLFMVIGAFIASLFYIIGCNSVSKNMSEKVIECDTLLVRDTIMVGKNIVESPIVYISADPTSAAIIVYRGKPSMLTGSHVKIEALGENSHIMMISRKGSAGISKNDLIDYNQW